MRSLYNTLVFRYVFTPMKLLTTTEEESTDLKDSSYELVQSIHLQYEDQSRCWDKLLMSGLVRLYCFSQ